MTATGVGTDGLCSRIHVTIVGKNLTGVGDEGIGRDERAGLEPRLGRSKTIVAIARKLLVAVWHVLTDQTGDRQAEVVNVAKSLFKLAYRMGVRNLPEGMSALTFTRIQMDRLGLGAEVTHLPWSGKRYKLPPSSLAPPAK
jgi:hypothetical protein